jgi:phospholipid/cholesterol/gamma-HCH transport system substrate-binding protein
MNRRKATRIGLACVTLLAVAVAVTLVNLPDPASDTDVTGIFADANPIVPGDTVRAAGVEVGKVTAVQLRNGKAAVRLTLDRSVLPLHQDASLTIRPVNLLGEQYLDLNTGSANAPVATGPATIAEARTGKSVDLQDVLNTMNDPTSTALAALITGMGEGVNGRGQQIADAIKALGPAANRTDQLTQILRGQNETLTSLIDHVQPVAGALAADHGKTMDSLVGSTQQVLSTVSANRQALDQSLAALPSTLRTAQDTLGRLAGAANAGTSTLGSIRPVTDNLTQISGEIQNFSSVADPALASLDPVLAKAQAMLDQAGPLVQQLGPAVRDLHGVADAAQPLATTAINSLGDIMDFVRWWALSTSGYDGLSHYFRGMLVATPKSLTGLATGALPAAPVPPAAKPGQPGPVPGVPSLPLLGGAQSPSPDPGNATGLTPNQEQGMLGQLLGGL